MADWRFKPVYWQHACPTRSPEDGDKRLSDTPAHPETPEQSHTRQGIRYTVIPSGKLKSIRGARCQVRGCRHIVTDKTVIANEVKAPISNLGGKNK